MNPIDPSTSNLPFQFASFQFSGLRSGPRLIVLGAVHGNESCGTLAINRILSALQSSDLVIGCGTMTLVPVTNPYAAYKKDRSGHRNLNRNFHPTSEPADFEDHVANWLGPLLSRHDVLLDLHSTRARNPPFVMLGPEDNDGSLEPFKRNAEERALARHLGVHRFVDGWLSTYAKGVERRLERAKSGEYQGNSLNTDFRYGIGTTEYMRAQGGYAITLECGQHEDPEAPNVAYQAILRALAFLGMIDREKPAPAENIEALHMVEVVDRLHADDRFSREWASFNALKMGDLIGTRHDGTQILAANDGYILFPDAKALPGNEWFYLARATPG